MSDSCDPMDCSPLGFSVHGIFQARILEWVAILFSGASSRPRDGTCLSSMAGRFFHRGDKGEQGWGSRARWEGHWHGSQGRTFASSVGDLSALFRHASCFQEGWHRICDPPRLARVADHFLPSYSASLHFLLEGAHRGDCRERRTGWRGRDSWLHNTRMCAVTLNAWLACRLCDLRS